MLTYNLTKSSRKTAAICIRDGVVEVRAPLRMPKHEINRFVLHNEQWILKNIAKQQAQAEKKAAFALDYGSHILLRGKQYKIDLLRNWENKLEAQPVLPNFRRGLISLRDGAHVGFDDEVLYMPPGLSQQQIKSTCIQLYKMLAKQHIPSRVAFFSSQMGETPSAIKINNAMRRWGSCSSSKSLNFSWRLIMAEDSAIDYVVVHELAHLKEMNHSTRFWAVVGGVLPGYKESIVKLKDLQRRLNCEDWM